MADQNDLKWGEWNAICDRCGHKFKSSQLRLEWTGFRVCHGPGTNDCWEARHPQLSVKSVPDKQSVPWQRNEPDDVELNGANINENDASFCTIEQRQGIAGVGAAGCMVPSFDSGLADDEDIPSSSFNITDTIGS